MVMNKINFFNDIMKVHDKENKLYNEKVADLILSSCNDAFDVYYEIFLRISEVYDIKPYHFTFFQSKEGKNYDSIDKFIFKINDDNLDIDSFCKMLNSEANSINTCYHNAEITYTKNSKKRIIFMKIENNDRFMDVTEHLRKLKESRMIKENGK